MIFSFGTRGTGMLASAYFLSGLIAFSSPVPLSGLNGQEIARRTIARAKTAGESGKLQNFTYKKLSISEELDSRGHVKERKEKVLFFRSGSGSLLEMKVNGRPVTGDDFRRQEELASQDRQKMTAGKTAKRDDNWEKYVTPDLLTKYHFTLLARTNYNGRPTYILSFAPVSRNLPVNQIADKLINQIAGKIWVDEQEYEVARAEVTLQSEVTLWGGVLGVLRKMYFVVDRTRVGENAWFNRSTFGDFEGRKLLDSTHMKLRSESSNFERILPMTSLK
jgi:hypothetical protein